MTDPAEVGGLQGVGGIRSNALRERNAALVWRLVASEGNISRAAISAATGLSPGAVTKITAQLMAAGFLTEDSAAEGRRTPGRPRVPLSVDVERFRVAGVHIGLHRTTVGTVDLRGRVTRQLVEHHTSNEPAELVREAAQLLVAVAADLGTDLLATGVCTGGWVDPERAAVRSHPVLGWTDISLAMIADATDAPTYFDSSVRAHALAEVQRAPVSAERSVLYAFIGNIIGAAHVLDGAIDRGRHAAAGVIDHITGTGTGSVSCSCGRSDCLWALASDVAVVSMARNAALIGPEEGMEAVSAAAERGEEAMVDLLRIRSQHVGDALASLIDFVAPDRLVVGGSVRLPFELEEVRSAIERRNHPRSFPRDRVSGSQLGVSPLVESAATLALTALYEDPLAFVLS